MGSPVSGQGLHKGQSRNGRRIGPHDAGAQGDGNDKGSRVQQGFFLVGKAAFGAYQNGGGRAQGFEACKGIVVDHGFIAVNE